MAFAPLDAWARLLFMPPAWIPVRYWPRLAFGVFASLIGTGLTLAERVTLWPLTRRARRVRHGPGVVVVLGYFRSGTTHLQYLLSCDPRMRTPGWCEALAPQGFVLSWSFLRLFMLPFLSSTRPQDDVAIGPSWPAEDDFAANNWAMASSLGSRFVLPRMYKHYSRFHSLAGLSDRELARWTRVQAAFCRKMSCVAGRRMLLLKSPSHTARVAKLVEIFGEGTRFVHISREPGAVVTSNIAMAERMTGFGLQDPPAREEIERRVVEEYVETQHRFDAESAALAPGNLARVRFEDLTADPLGEIRRVYAALGIAWDARHEARMKRYLATVEDYQPATRRGGERPRSETPELEAMAHRYGHDRPAPARVSLELPRLSRGTGALAGVTGAAVAIVCLALWLASAYAFRQRDDWLIWPTGVAIGLAAIHTAHGGGRRLGLWLAALTLLVYLVGSLPVAFLMDYAHRDYYRDLSGGRAWGLLPWRPEREWEWYHIKKASRDGALGGNSLFWVFMGVMSAYRYGSRRWLHPPGRG